MSHPLVKMSSFSPCIVLSHLTKACVRVEGSHLCKDCSGRNSNCTVYWEKNPQNLWFLLLEHWLGCIQINSF